MRVLPVLLSMIILGTAAARAAEPAADPAGDALTARGAEVAARRCTRCHAVGETGDSPEPAAPKFRELYRRYAPDTLEAALREGLLSSHPMMPEFRFAPGEVDGLVRYLRAVQARQPG